MGSYFDTKIKYLASNKNRKQLSLRLINRWPILLLAAIMLIIGITVLVYMSIEIAKLTSIATRGLALPGKFEKLFESLPENDPVRDTMNKGIVAIGKLSPQIIRIAIMIILSTIFAITVISIFTTVTVLSFVRKTKKQYTFEVYPMISTLIFIFTIFVIINFVLHGITTYSFSEDGDSLIKFSNDQANNVRLDEETRKIYSDSVSVLEDMKGWYMPVSSLNTKMPTTAVVQNWTNISILISVILMFLFQVKDELNYSNYANKLKDRIRKYKE